MQDGHKMCDCKFLASVVDTWTVWGHQSLYGKMAEVRSKSVLFMCLCNICRSPNAEAVFRKLVTDENISANWRIDSVATSIYEVGNPPPTIVGRTA